MEGISILLNCKFYIFNGKNTILIQNIEVILLSLFWTWSFVMQDLRLWYPFSSWENKSRLSKAWCIFMVCNSKTQLEENYAKDTVEEKCLCTICTVWSKITLISGSVGGTGVDPPSCKTSKFCLWSLAFSMPIYRNFKIKWS